MERRIHRRFIVKEGGFVILQSEPFLVGKINDISRGGVSLLYAAKKMPNIEAREINIIFTKDSFYLAIDQFKYISDIKISQEAHNLDSLSMRRHSLQFRELSKSQLLELEFFIDTYTRS